MTQQELTVKIEAFSVQLTKAIEEIKTAVSNQPNATPELEAAVEKLGGLVQQADDLNPDAPPPPPGEEGVSKKFK